MAWPQISPRTGAWLTWTCCRVAGIVAQAIVSSGLSATTTESEPFEVRRKPRTAHIVSPQDGQTFHAGEPIVFYGAPLT